MKRILKATALGLMFSVGSLTMQQCYGSFTVTKKLYNWNGTIGNKFVNTAVMWVMIIIPVYGVGFLVDFIVLNTLEFWTGSNPLAMGPNDKETQIVQLEGKEFEITATQNRFDIKSLNEKDYGRVTSMVYQPEDSTWYLLNADGQKMKIASLKPGDTTVKLYHPDGETVDVNL